MKFEKRVLSNLTKCYAVSPLLYRRQKHFLVASEKDYPCLLFTEQGAPAEQVWPGTPGGTMSLVPLEDGSFLATQGFYSPDDSKNARIVRAIPREAGGWSVETVVKLPHVHRFDVLRRNGMSYLLACTICSGREYKGDWRFPGKVYGCALPDDPGGIGAGKLRLEVLGEDLYKNHGYLRYHNGPAPAGLAACESGVYRFTPPESFGKAWEVDQLLEAPVSDICMVDFDGDGMDEMVTIGPFHGDTLTIYKYDGGAYREVYTHPTPMPFAHAIWGGILRGRPAAVIGCRREARELLCLTGTGEGFSCQVIDSGTGAANVWHDTVDGREVLLAANREIDEVALYTVTGD